MTTNGQHDMEETFARALVTEDEAYLRMEEELVAGGYEAETTLRRHRDDPDPMAQLLSEALLEVVADESDMIERATRFIRFAGDAAAKSIKRIPSPSGLADTLTIAFGPGLAPFLAVRLVKESQLPHWQALTMLAYLDRHKTPSTTDAIIRFAGQTPIPELQRAAAQVLANSGDPALPQKLAAERQRLAGKGTEFPAVLASLLQGGGAGRA